MEVKKNKLCICMGSSCFARGNEKNLELLEEYLTKFNITDKVELSGSRCEGKCSNGPNILVNGVIQNHVETGSLLDLLNQLFGKEDVSDPGNLQIKNLQIKED
ncbi:MAG: (2Fe-2S) ferredoxin domain-containing protein [Clostridiales bacterium]